MITPTPKIIECPRDAMQGWPHPISTEAKVTYLNALLKVGFDTLDCGSFVSPKAIPQMADTAEVLNRIDLEGSPSKLLVIVANERGAEAAAGFEQVSFLGYPFSVSETFQQKNTNAGITEAKARLDNILKIARDAGKETVVYLSMGFGNPYGDPHNEAMVVDYAKELADAGAAILSVADTVGVAQPSQISSMMKALYLALPGTEIGVHLHAAPEGRDAKLKAAWNEGCRRFDGAMKGIGGCPMAGNDLVGNMDTEHMLRFFQSQNTPVTFDEAALDRASAIAAATFI